MSKGPKMFRQSFSYEIPMIYTTFVLKIKLIKYGKHIRF